MPHIGMQELLLILIVVLVLFGGKKLPEFARGLGTAIREMRSSMKDEPHPNPNAPVNPPTPDVNAKPVEPSSKG